MEVDYTNSFEIQLKKYSFHFTCDSCVHFDDRQSVCIHGYPNQMHRLSLYTGETKPRSIMFCKDFDMV